MNEEADYEAMDELISEMDNQFEAIKFIRSCIGISLLESKYYFENKICPKYPDAICVKKYEGRY